MLYALVGYVILPPLFVLTYFHASCLRGKFAIDPAEAHSAEITIMHWFAKLSQKGPPFPVEVP